MFLFQFKMYTDQVRIWLAKIVYVVVRSSPNYDHQISQQVHI